MLGIGCGTNYPTLEKILLRTRERTKPDGTNYDDPARMEGDGQEPMEEVKSRTGLKRR